MMTREQIEKEIHYFTVREITKAKIAKAGLPVPPKPRDAEEGIDLFVEWENIKRQYGSVANIPFHVLGDFLDRWTAMISYARWCEAIADIDQSTAREIRDTIKKQLYTLQEGSREIRDAMVYTEPLYREWEKRYAENYSLYIAIKALREGYEYRANAISREITRRSSDMNDTRRSINRGNLS